MNRFYEELSMNAWPSLKTHHYDGWVLRYANRYTKRANSVYPLYDGKLDMVEKLAYCEKYYADLNMPTTFKMHDGEELHNLDIFLEDNGYHVLTPTDVLTMSLVDKSFEADMDYRVTRSYAQEWSDWYTESICDDPGSEQAILIGETVNRILQSITPETVYVFIEDDGKVVAAANGVLEAGNLGIYNVVVKEGHRGRGYGKALMSALLKEGQAMGATSSYLQVICSNETAMNLYLGMGYEKQYRYWYRRKKEETVR